MRKCIFERRLSKVIPQPDAKTSSALFDFGRSLGHDAERDGVREILNSLSFIARHFDRQTAQSIYETVRYGSVVCPDEMIAAALCIHQDGYTPSQTARLVLSGQLTRFYTPKAFKELSPIASCTIMEDGKSRDCCTMYFNSFDPTVALPAARKYACAGRTSVTYALLSLSIDMKPAADSGAEKIFMSGSDNFSRMLADAFGKCAVTAAHIDLDIDRNQVAVEHNPMWMELRSIRDINQDGVLAKLW